MAAETVEGQARFLNRELSWLDFNARVLEVASEAALPLLTRVNFCSIFSSNLDEFFMVRVAGLTDQAAAGIAVRSPDGMTPQEALREIRDRALRLTGAQAKLWKRQLKPALEEQGITIAEIEDLNAAELEELETVFKRQIFPVLTPLAVGPGQPFPYISGLSLSLGLFVRDPETGEERFARVKVPEVLPRFLPVGQRGHYLPLERVIRHFLSWLFPMMEIVECTVFRVTRDADFAVSDEADDLLEAVELELRRRRFGEAVRVEISGSCSSRMLAQLKHGLAVEDPQVYLVPGLLDLADLLELVGLDRPDLKEDAWVPVVPRRFVSEDESELFDEIRRGPVLVHHPYDSFAGTFEAFMATAARDDATVAMKTSVYRTSADSPHVPAVMEAAEEGKQTVCLVELKARFDERRNIEWARSLESAGVHVVYGYPSLKIHAKGTLVVRREEDGLRRYAHIGTGNYNAVTVYRAVPAAWAADAGVKIDIFARTTCTLRPRKQGGKEDIRVRTLLGRFFEHSRFYIFEADGESTYLLGSADLMARNLDHRIEILVPLEDARAQRELARTFESIMDDTRFSWALRADGSWERVRSKKGGRGQSLHGALMRRARARARAAAMPRGR